MSVRARKSGLNRETQNKINNKYGQNQDLAAQCLEWMHYLINSNLLPEDDPIDFDTDSDRKNFATTLHDGVILARTMDILMPGSIPPKLWKRSPKLPFKQMELIDIFVKKAKEFGVPEHEAFQTCDLYEEQNLFQVVMCLQSLGRKAKAKGLDGFGPKESEAAPRKFSEETLRAGQCVIGLQMGTNKGASQSGMNFGKTRSILD